MKDKIIKLFQDKEAADIRYFQGFNYIKLDKDKNGNNFNAEHLSLYARHCRYLVTVMREKHKKTVLYNYEVPSDKLLEFLLKFQNNELDGSIIEIDKYLPDDFA